MIVGDDNRWQAGSMTIWVGYWQSEDFVPVGVERFVLRLRLEAGIIELEDAERVRLAAQVGGRQPGGPVHLHAQVAHVAEVLQSPVGHVTHAERVDLLRLG